jgi:hypothetical protein
MVLSHAARLHLQDLETALKHFVLNSLTTTTFKEESEPAILLQVIEKALARNEKDLVWGY